MQAKKNGSFKPGAILSSLHCIIEGPLTDCKLNKVFFPEETQLLGDDVDSSKVDVVIHSIEGFGFCYNTYRK